MGNWAHLVCSKSTPDWEYVVTLVYPRRANQFGADKFCSVGKNIEEDFGNVSVKVSNQTDSNGRSTLLLRGDNANITFTNNGGREIKQLNVSLGSYNQEKVGELAIQYRSGSQWKDAKVLHKNGLPTGQNYNGMYSHSSGVGNGKGGPGKNRYAPASTDNLSSYKVSFPSGVFEARIIVRGHKNVVAIIDHVTLM